MDYYLNEYSLRGQFKDVDEFFETLRKYTLPVLKKIEEQKENVIFKKDTFWQREICNGISLIEIPGKKNERSVEMVLLKMELAKLISSEPFWESGCESGIEIEEYRFDEEYRDNFEEPNCFSKALENEGRIVSFVHPNYKIFKLPLVVKGIDVECSLDNIYDVTWWKCEPEVRTWNIDNKYEVQVRAKEFEYHPPHFHVISNEYSAVFRLSNGELYTSGKKKWTTKMIAEINEWYEKNKEELQKAWKLLHNNDFQ